MTIAEFDHLSTDNKKDLLFACCASHQWVRAMMDVLPAKDIHDILEYAEENWFDCNHSDWLEAFKNAADSCTGGGLDADNDISANPGGIQKQTTAVQNDPSSKSFTKAKDEYEETFGYRFICFADDKPVAALLTELEERLRNDPREELTIAAREQDKITRYKLGRLFS